MQLPALLSALLTSPAPPAFVQVRVGNYRGEEVHVPFSSLLPMVHPNDFVLGGWDISGERSGEAQLLEQFAALQVLLRLLDGLLCRLEGCASLPSRRAVVQRTSAARDQCVACASLPAPHRLPAPHPTHHRLQA